ncbi:MAG TPA: hypothetical protein VG711_03815, partial [Phycisphaerales bacterium]|nr:hypothetical protein [Phycisphaerales bacterium]
MTITHRVASFVSPLTLAVSTLTCFAPTPVAFAGAGDCQVMSTQTVYGPPTIQGYGPSVAINDSFGFVGANNAGTGGEVYVYHLDGEQWITEPMLLAPDAVSGASFGFSVSVL